MTDSQIIQGIKDNSSEVWRHICRNMLPPFIATLKRISPDVALAQQDWDDIFQESCVIMMENIKAGKFEERAGASLFSYFVEIGRRTMKTVVRKKAKERPAVKKIEGSTHILVFAPKAAEAEPGAEQEVSTEEKQTEQNEFIDRVFDSIPEDCKMLLKKFYWDKKPMDEIASMLGLRNANSAKTTKNRCMNKLKEIAAKLLENEEFAEEVVRASVERAALKELLASELEMMNDSSIRMAALKVDDKNEGDE